MRHRQLCVAAGLVFSVQFRLEILTLSLGFSVTPRSSFRQMTSVLFRPQASLLFSCVPVLLAPQSRFGFGTQGSLRFHTAPLLFAGPVQFLDLGANASFLFGPGTCFFFDLATQSLEFCMLELILMSAAARLFFNSPRLFFGSTARLLQSISFFFLSAVTCFDFKPATFSFSCQTSFFLQPQLFFLLGKQLSFCFGPLSGGF